MDQFRYLMPLDTMERITQKQLCDDFDMVLERVDKENIGFVIVDNDGKEGHVLCPARWMHYCFDDDFGCIINSALRYAIGRHTYMPKTVVEFVRKYIEILDTKTIDVAIQDINKAMQYGEVDDPGMWYALKKDLENRLAYLYAREESTEKK